VYDSGHLYDFGAALAAAKGVSPVTVKDQNAADNALYFLQLRKIDRHGCSTVLAVPSGDALHRHAQRFGPELVNETGKLLGVDANVKRKPATAKRHRRTTADLTAQVLDLHGRGVVETAIADSLNIGDERVRDILRAAA
jgi:hypothetical protein